MKRLLGFGIVATTAITITILTQSENSFESLNTKNSTQKRIPIPTQVNEKMANEKEYEEQKEQYWDIIHGGAETNWRAINEEIFRQKIQARIERKGLKAVSSYANGSLAGEWFERGSTNQAGNVRITTFDEQTNAIYAIGDGGILFKGDINGGAWESLNDHYLLGTDVLECIRLQDGTLRILAAIGNGVYYSDDEGSTWTAATGFIGSTWDGSSIDLIELNDADSTIVFLYTYKSVAGNNQNKLAYSKDHGQSFIIEHIFNSSSPNFASMASIYNSNTAYILDNDDDVWVFQDDSLFQIADALALQGGAQCQLEITTSVTDTIMYVLMDQHILYKSNDGGFSFNQLADLPVPSWEVGIGTSIDNPDAVYFGEVELYRSINGGNNFNKVNDWWEYYGDPVNYIHADIMHIQSYKTSTGTEFTLIPNHGGLSISYDNLSTTENIGMVDLNVGQFYDVATSPVNSAFILGGTQDQGFQRTGLASIPGKVQFEQIISGDYGQQQFSNNGQAIWTQYPGADFSYYGNAILDNGADYWYQVDGSDLPNAGWIVPTASAPNASDDYILVGGGNINGGSGSYLIKLQNIGSTAVPTQYNFDFIAASGQPGKPISAVETTPLNPSQWYVSTENGKFFHSEDAGSSWTQTTEAGGPGNDWIYSSDIYASRLTHGLVFLGGTNYFSSCVYMSIDSGQTFVPLNNGDLPNATCYELCMDPEENFLFAATDAGPYVYDMNQEEWFDLSGDVAPIQYYISCEYIASQDIVRFATWGRGIWDFYMADVTGTEEMATYDINKIYPNPNNGQFNINSENGALLKVFDLNGKQLANLALLPGINPINLSHLSSGTYVLVSMDQNGIMRKDKLVIRK
ncbi:T9SS type A sorting domain-containing protein [Paracrocinitomix mangrovi]|uniref:T9SS type A sorting domain-containing protein n=1 Tax=Paracrocinitomix mangrovi TaxID=2862509 RepID=UPI001C8E2B63|nr:T9SS type A sorting domain-containing protein [Paracrocinitomix mangrovi]UKN02930.1 T9SS type A sorting domain-containing protein [Paracrocinitomix mangrovi]